MKWDLPRLLEGIETFQRRTSDAQKSMVDGSLGGGTLLGSPVEQIVPGVPVANLVDTVAASYVLFDSPGVATADNNSTSIPWNSTALEEQGDHGVTLSGLGTFIVNVPHGLYVVGSVIRFATNATGLREIHLTGTVLPAATFPTFKNMIPAISGEPHTLSLCVPFRSAEGADQFWIFGRQASGGPLNVLDAMVSIARVA